MELPKMELHRRQFLRAASATGILLPFSGVSRAAFGQAIQGDNIQVVLFLRGGCDSLNLVGPANDANYIEDRIAPLRVLDSGDKPGIRLANGLDPKLDFRLHPDAAPLGELYSQGHLAIVHAVGLTNETRSHFVAQELIERGVVSDGTDQSTGAKSAVVAESGWLDRYARLVGLDHADVQRITALSASNGVDKAMDGFAPALALPDLNNGVPLAGGDQARAVLSALYASVTGDIAQSGRLTLSKFATVDAHIPKGPDGKVMPYQAENGASYDEGGESGGRGLEAIARMIKMDVGLRVACVDMGGWDTHENQGPRFNNLAAQLGRNMMAFWNDLAAYHDRVTVVTISDFGRRLRSNKSNGTDHGHAGAMFVLGGRVNGGRMYGRWPGLSTPDLDRAVDLAVTTDYRAVLSAVASGGFAPPQIQELFPGYKPERDLGIVRRA
jgi:uncharacterized protein (DUF1501 family)